MWNKKTGMYFQLEMNDPSDHFSLAKLAVKKLHQFEGAGMHVEYLELRFDESPLDSSEKKAYIKIDCRGRTFIFSESYSRWYDVLTAAFDHVQDYCRSEETSTELRYQQEVFRMSGISMEP